MRPCIQFIQDYFGDSPLVGAEIGVFQGENSKKILEELPNVKLLYLIDPYEVYEDWKDRLKQRIIAAKQRAEKLLQPFNDRVVWVQKRTEDCMEHIMFPLDFIYIDGNHDYTFVKKDLSVAMELVKSKGVIGGHDYRRGVKLAVNEFCHDNEIQLHLKLKVRRYSDWWFIKP